MDDYVTKPLRREDLASVLARWIPRREPGRGAGARPAEEGDGLDRRTLDGLLDLDSVGRILREVVSVFLRNSPGRLEAIRAAMQKGDPQALERSSHAFAGACGGVGARRMAGLYQLERQGRSQEKDGVHEAVAALAAYAAVRPTLEAIVAERPAV